MIVQDDIVFAGFTTRPVIGAERRRELAEAAAKGAGAAVRLSLVHGTAVARISFPDVLHAQNGIIDCEETDAAVTDLSNVVLTSGHGDCLPLYFYDPAVPAIGLAHAGWRGTLANIARETVEAMVRYFSSDAKDIRAWIGPGIGRCCFEVDADVADSFLCSFDWATDCVDRCAEGKYHIDLKEINRRQLADCGVSAVQVSDLCTVCRPDLFYSYRRGRERERMLAYICLKGDQSR